MRPTEDERVLAAVSAATGAERARCALALERWAENYPEDVFPSVEVTDAQSATVLRSMLPRVARAIRAHGVTGGDAA
jgi:hypothetical protein